MEIYTRKQVAALFQVTPNTVSKWACKGLITATCFVNGRPRFSHEEVMRVVTEQSTHHSKKNKGNGENDSNNSPA